MWGEQNFPPKKIGGNMEQSKLNKLMFKLVKVKKIDDELDEKYNKLMKIVNIGIGLSLIMFFVGIAMIIFDKY